MKARLAELRATGQVGLVGRVSLGEVWGIHPATSPTRPDQKTSPYGRSNRRM